MCKYSFSSAVTERDQTVASFVELNRRYSRYLDDGYDFEDAYEDYDYDWGDAYEYGM